MYGGTRRVVPALDATPDGLSQRMVPSEAGLAPTARP